MWSGNQPPRYVLCALLVGLCGILPARANPWMSAPALLDITVQDQDGHPLQFYSDLLQGRTVVIDFIFTGCTTVCPMQTAILRDVRNRLSDSKTDQGEVLLISVTIDPKHDGPQQLREYAQRFQIAPGLRHGWVFVTGEPRELKKLLYAFKSETSQPASHSNILWIGNEPQQRWTRTAAFNTPQHVTQLVREIVR